MRISSNFKPTFFNAMDPNENMQYKGNVWVLDNIYVHIYNIISALNGQNGNFDEFN